MASIVIRRSTVRDGRQNNRNENKDQSVTDVEVESGERGGENSRETEHNEDCEYFTKA